jgi:hexosaminidase
MHCALGLLAFCLLPSLVAAATIIPRPVEQRSTDGAFVLAADTVVVAHPDARTTADLLRSQLAPATGFALETTTRPALGSARRRLRLCGTRSRPTCRTWIFLARSRDRKLPTEGYRLEVRPGRVTIRARTAAGWFYGAQTLRQLLPPAILDAAPVSDVDWSVPAQRIDDAPRFAWRGVMLDSARHFFPATTVMRLIDQLAFHKLNRLHWHLSDDQGWRVQINALPALTTVGAVRSESPNRLLPRGGFLNFFVSGGLGPWTAGFDGTPYGGFYTQDEIRTVVAYAAARHIEIVPEIDMPGHIQAAIAAYPALGSGTPPVAVRTAWGLPTAILNPSDATFAFIDTVLDEMAALFPGAYFHMGGDEVNLADWSTNADAQARIAALGLADPAALKEWFVNRVMTAVAARGRRPMGWNEVLHDDLHPDAIVTAWTSAEAGRDAARLGHDVVMAPLTATYFDHANGLPLPQPEQSQLEAIGGVAVALAPLFTTDLPEVYAYDPVLAGMTAAEAAHVLGGQGQLWSEFIHDQADLDRQAFPRVAALAEVLWTPKALRNLSDFQARLPRHLARLARLGIGHYHPEQP